MNDKFPVSGENAERFISMVMNLAELTGVTKDREVAIRLDMLAEAVLRSINEKRASTAGSILNQSRKRFIQIWKNRYSQTMDLEYAKAISAAEGKMIGNTITFLTGAGFTEDEFLEWLFDDYIEDNPKFKPPTINSACSQYVLHAFADANREKREANKRKIIVKKDVDDHFARARVLLKEALPEEARKALVQAIKDFGANKLTLNDFKGIVAKMEEILNAQVQGNKTA